jgi:DNA-binding PadR family transcriptional regulator
MCVHNSLIIGYVALRHAILAALLEGEASGYELAKRFDVSVANFWSATPQQLYRELEQMQRAGLLAARVVEQARRPKKRMLSITSAGYDELTSFTRRPPRPLALRDELLVQVQALDAGDAEPVAEAVAHRLEQARAKLALYDELRERLLAGRSEAEYLARGGPIGPYLTLMRGRAFEHENIAWAQRAVELIARRPARSVGAGEAE